MKLSEIKNGNLSAEWAEKGYELPKFDIEAVKAKTHAEPTWVHFGAGNIFRAFPAAILNDALNTGKYDRGVIVAESFDYEIIDKAYRPYDNMSLLVCLKSTGEIEKKVVASVTESLKADYSFGEDWARLVEIFQNPSLQMISFTITEKGYGVAPADLERGLNPVLDVPGYKKAVIRPQPDVRLGAAKARVNTAAGYYATGWQYEDNGEVTYTVVIQFDAEAEVYLPKKDGTTEEMTLTAGTHTFTL